MGVIRDRDSGKPLAGVMVEPSKITNPWNISNHNEGLLRTTTDKDGRYRLVGLPKGEDNRLVAMTNDLPYLHAVQKVENTPGLEPVTVDFALRRGIWVTGRVTEKTTGKPMRGGVGYYCFRDNPYKKEIPVMFGGSTSGLAREDGSYRIVALPGHGLIAVQVHHNNRYLLGIGAEQIKGPRREIGGMEGFDTYPFLCQTWNFNTLVEITPKDGDESITRDLVVIPGRSLTGTVLGPDGKPLAGARFWGTTLASAEFTEWGINPDKPERRVLDFVHEGKKLAGFLVIKGDEKGPLQVRLQPWGAFTGRLVTPQGDPLTDVVVSCKAGDAYPDKNGRFRLEGLIPGWKYELYPSKEGLVLNTVGKRLKDLIVKPGETRDVGDVIVKVRE